MKIKFLLLLLLSFSWLVVFSQNAFAVGNPQLCSDPTKGCIFCHPNTSGICVDGRDDFDTASTGNNCATGYVSPAGTDTESTYCLNLNCNGVVEIACSPVTVPRGGFDCLEATATQPKQCSPCDNDPATATPNCRVPNTPQYTTRDLCLSSCLPTNPQNCGVLNARATCKASCATNETPISASCPTGAPVCCLPNDLVGAPGTGTTVTVPEFTGTCDGGQGIDTAIGCIPFGSLNAFGGFFLKWGLGFAGGIGFLFLIYASFMIMTSQGDPKRLQTGKELLFSAISGIMLLIFSGFILKLLGVTVLGIFR